MSKEDVGPAPDRIPQKRRQIEDAPALWLRQWLVKPDITYREKQRLSKEIERRKKEVRPLRVGILVGDEGVTPQQLRSMDTYLQKSGATAIHHSYVASKVHTAAKRLDVPVVVHGVGSPRDFANQEIVRNSDVVIAAVKQQERKAIVGVWAGINYAKHRRTPVRVFTPDGKEVT
jgi:hypothetical protein